MSSDEDAELQSKVKQLAQFIREQHGPDIDYATMLRILEDPSCVFNKTRMVFDEHPLKEGEFAYMHQADANPSKGFMLYMHPHFKDKTADLPYLMAYHLVVVNFGRDVSYEMAELFGAELFAMSSEEYYERVNGLYENLLEAQG